MKVIRGKNLNFNKGLATKSTLNKKLSNTNEITYSVGKFDLLEKPMKYEIEELGEESELGNAVIIKNKKERRQTKRKRMRMKISE
jgi:hypothetical protein